MPNQPSVKYNAVLYCTEQECLKAKTEYIREYNNKDIKYKSRVKTESYCIPFEEFPEIEIQYKEFKQKKYYIPDFLCYENIVVENKAIRQCTPNEEAQIINELKSSKKRVGVLFNFGEPSLYWKRYVY